MLRSTLLILWALSHSHVFLSLLVGRDPSSHQLPRWNIWRSEIVPQFQHQNLTSSILSVPEPPEEELSGKTRASVKFHGFSTTKKNRERFAAPSVKTMTYSIRPCTLVILLPKLRIILVPLQGTKRILHWLNSWLFHSQTLLKRFLSLEGVDIR